VYNSTTRALGDGVAVCLGLDLTASPTCATPLIENFTYQFEATVTNTGEADGNFTSTEFRDVIAALDVLGSMLVGDLLTGCDDDGSDKIWTPTIVTDDAVGTGSPSASCEIEGTSGSEVYYWIATPSANSDDGTATFYGTDGTATDESGVVTFTVINEPSAPPVGDSESKASSKSFRIVADSVSRLSIVDCSMPFT